MFTTFYVDDLRIKQRSILWYLVFVGFSVNYMIRINVNISIVDMIDQSFRKVTNNTLIESECIDRSLMNVTTDEPPIEERRSRFPSLERLLLDALGVKSRFLIRGFSYHIFACHANLPSQLSLSAC